jgi:hypothetical protein
MEDTKFYRNKYYDYLHKINDFKNDKIIIDQKDIINFIIDFSKTANSARDEIIKFEKNVDLEIGNYGLDLFSMTLNSLIQFCVEFEKVDINDLSEKYSKFIDELRQN